MSDSLGQHIARLDRHEITQLPAHWTDAERGRFLRMLLGYKGIDTRRFFTITYHPHRRCWLVSQAMHASEGAKPQALPTAKDDTSLYLRLRHELTRTARAATAVLAAQSPEFARLGRRYELPPPEQEMTPAGLARLLKDGPGTGPSIQFDSEGGWRASGACERSVHTRPGRSHRSP